MEQDMSHNLHTGQYTIVGGDMYVTEMYGASIGANVKGVYSAGSSGGIWPRVCTDVTGSVSTGVTSMSRVPSARNITTVRLTPGMGAVGAADVTSDCGAGDSVDDIGCDDEMSEEAMSDVSSLDSCGLDESADLANENFVHEFATQLASSGPVGVAAAAAISTTRRRNRAMTFEINPAIRKRQQTRLLRKMKALLEEYTARVGQQAAVLCCTPGSRSQPPLSFRVFGSKPLETAIREHRGSIMTELEQALGAHAVPPAASRIPDPHITGVYDFELPPLTVDGIPTPVDKMTQAQLRMFIPEMLKHSTGRSKPGWGKDECCPEWWPPDVPWANVRSDMRSEELKKEVPWTHILREIILNCYRYHGREDLIPDYNSSSNGCHGNLSFGNDTNGLHQGEMLNGLMSVDQLETGGERIGGRISGLGSNTITLPDGRQTRIIGPLSVINIKTSEDSRMNQSRPVSVSQSQGSSLYKPVTSQAPLKHVIITTVPRNKTGALGNIQTSAPPQLRLINTAQSSLMGTTQSSLMGTTQSGLMDTVKSSLMNATQSRLMNTTQSRLIVTAQSRLIDTTQSRLIDTTQSRLMNTAQSSLIDTAESRLMNTTQSRLLNTAQSRLMNTAQSRLMNTAQGNHINPTQADSVESRHETSSFLQMFSNQAESASNISADLHLLSHDISDTDVTDLHDADSSTNDSRGFNGMGVVDCIGELQLLADENSGGVDEISLELHDMKGDNSCSTDGDCRSNMTVDCNMLTENSGSSLSEMVSGGVAQQTEEEFMNESDEPAVEVSIVCL